MPSEKRVQLDLIAAEMRACTACKLSETRTRAVPGCGAFDARVFVIGEAPGEKEDEKGIPFVGPAGKMLVDIFKACKFRARDIFIANTLGCRPPCNRFPEPAEQEACRHFLERQIDLVDPEFLLLLGSAASKLLLGMPISEARGRWHTYRGFPTLAVYHPAYLLHHESPESKKTVWRDLQPLIHACRKPREADPAA